MASRKYDRVALAAAFLLSCISIAPIRAEPEIKYPIIFSSMSDLEELGLSLDWPPPDYGETLPKPKFNTGCYLYRGQIGDYVISVSDELLNSHKARGFSRESLCLALVSQARFDPETGARLPTYILRDDTVLDKRLSEIDPAKVSDEKLAEESQGIFPSVSTFKRAIMRAKRRDFSGLTTEQVGLLATRDHFTEELPISAPDCFKNGTPLRDCTWNYSLTTGKKLSPQAPVLNREVGEELDRQATAYLARGVGERPYGADDPYLKNAVALKHYLLIDRLVTPVHFENVDDEKSYLALDLPTRLAGWADTVTWLVSSPNLPRGYGYALNAFSQLGEAGDQGFTSASLNAAHDKERRSTRALVARVKRALR